MSKAAEFRQQLDRNKDHVYGYAVYLLRDREDAEEVTQHVFVRLWQNWERIDKAKVKAWIMKVAHNQCIDYARKRRISKDLVITMGPNELSTFASNPSDSTDPELRYELTQTRNAVLSALNRLPDQARSMILLHYYQGLSYETIGQILNVTLSKVKVTIHRGKKRMKDILLERSPEVVESL